MTESQNHANIRVRYIIQALLIFTISFLCFQYAYQSVDRDARRSINHMLNARPAAYLLNLFSGGEHVWADGSSIVMEKARLNIMKGCEGYEVMLLFTAAVLAFPFGWKQKSLCLLLGLPAIYALGLVRIVSLFLIVQHVPDQFELFHVVVWQTLMIVISGFMFFGFIRKFYHGGKHVLKQTVQA